MSISLQQSLSELQGLLDANKLSDLNSQLSKLKVRLAVYSSGRSPDV